MNKIKVFHDGKPCRDVDAEIIGRRASGIKVRFYSIMSEQLVECWFVRRKGHSFHTYEAIGWNYWLYD